MKANLGPLPLGLALFSMFFGSGNLIFPLAIGRIAGEDWDLAAFGFIITAVLLPFLGVWVMVLFAGNYKKFFDTIGPRWGFIWRLLLLTFWIPLGSAPRCITLSHAAIAPQLGNINLFTFSLGYSLIVFWLALKKTRMLKALAFYLTPLLLIGISLLLKESFTSTTYIANIHTPNIAWTSLLEGYNTMDLIAAFFFSSSLMADGSVKRRTAMQAGLIGILTLAVVYIGLIYMAAQHGTFLKDVPKEQLLIQLAHILIPKYSDISGWIIGLACLSTSVALVRVFAEFLKELLPKSSNALNLSITSIISFGLSILGFSKLAAIYEPAFIILYPLLLIMIIFQLCKKGHQHVSTPDLPVPTRNPAEYR